MGGPLQQKMGRHQIQSSRGWLSCDSVGLGQGHQAFKGQQVWEGRTLRKSKKDLPSFKLTQVTRSASGGPSFLRSPRRNPVGCRAQS